MIRLTHVSSTSPAAQPLVLLPGGPGLSSQTLATLKILNRSFDLYFVDLPGANDTPYMKGYTFWKIIDLIRTEVIKLGQGVHLIGHSFGGLLAAGVALEAPNVTGLGCLATPFTKRCLDAATVRYEAAKGPALAAAEGAYLMHPSDRTFSAWLAEYDALYFSNACRLKGARLLAGDPCCHRLFLDLRKDAEQGETLLLRLKNWTGKKLFVAGADDGLLPKELLKLDTSSAGFEFHAVPAANHFIMFDQPEIVARLIEVYFAAKSEKLE